MRKTRQEYEADLREALVAWFVGRNIAEDEIEFHAEELYYGSFLTLSGVATLEDGTIIRHGVRVELDFVPQRRSERMHSKNA